MFFTNNFNAQNINRARQRHRQRQQRYEEEYEEEQYQRRNQPQRNNRAALLVQLLPLFILMIFSVFPSIFQNVKKIIINFSFNSGLIINLREMKNLMFREKL